MANMNTMISYGVSALVLAVLFMVAPMIGENVDNAYTPGAASQWNESVNTDLTTGAGFWTDMGAIISIGALVVVVGGVIIKSLMGVAGGN
ncbi:MAG: hypothetical protein JXA38_05110 [Methanosarcinaceae archaeon]|nr:hypothetical protein [Methanosarcinaceae archaeon]